MRTTAPPDGEGVHAGIPRVTSQGHQTDHCSRERAERRASRFAAGCSWFLGVGFGVPSLYGIWYFARTGQVASFLGFPTYGDGPFDRAGISTSLPLLISFLVVCTAEIGVGWLLWHQRSAAAMVSVTLLPIELLFWFGFDLPYGPPLGFLRTAAVLTALLMRRRRTSAY